MPDPAVMVGQGFALGFVVWFTCWAITIPIRWFLRTVGMASDY